MITFKNLTIIGTSHIALQSIKEVKEAIKLINPHIIALELDSLRFKKLTSKNKKNNLLRGIGSRGFLLNLVGAWAEKKLGEKVNISPGSEMKAAIEIAKKENIKIALIDQDIRITLKNLSKNFTLKEKLRFLKDLLLSMFTNKNKINIDLTKVPEKDFIKKIIKEVKEKYPNLYKALVEDRNKVMAANLITLININKPVLAIVGAGHEEDLIKEVKWLLKNKK